MGWWWVCSTGGYRGLQSGHRPSQLGGDTLLFPEQWKGPLARRTPKWASAGEKIGQCVGDNDGYTANSNGGQTAKKETHGGLEAGVNEGNEHIGCVSC